MSGRVPPSSRAGKFRMTAATKNETEQASRLYESFSGHKPESVGKITLDKPVKVGIVIGELDGLLYTTIRDGNVEKYIHKFKVRSRPLLVVSSDGQQLLIVGGDYDFTERGIVDRK